MERVETTLTREFHSAHFVAFKMTVTVDGQKGYADLSIFIQHEYIFFNQTWLCEIFHSNARNRHF